MQPLTMCRFDYTTVPEEYQEEYPFSKNDHFVYLGDIKQMPGHCVVIRTKDNKVFTCYHTDNFVELTEDEC